MLDYQRLFKRYPSKPSNLHCSPLSLRFEFFLYFFSGKLGRENQSRSRAVGWGGISWVSLQRGKYFESAALIRFEIYLFFMSVCFRSFYVSHVVYMSQTNLLLYKLSESMMKSSCCSSYFGIKCNNIIKDSFEFFYQELFLPLKYV